MESKDSIANKYSIIKNLGSGGQATCYLVRKYGENINYVAKMDNDLEKANEEIKINKIITSKIPPIPYVIKLIDSGDGDFIRGEKHLKNQRYIILEYALKGDLHKYIKFTNEGFGEKCGKLLFYKILLGVRGCHEAGVYHRDLKLENIVIDENFEPKICDFGFATDESGELSHICGTKMFFPPQFIFGRI